MGRRVTIGISVVLVVAIALGAFYSAEIVRVTGRDLAGFASEKLWKPLGMEHDAYFLTDGTGMEWAFGGLNVSLRDLARMGWLFANGGRRGDRQIVPADWVRASVTPDAPHLVPGPDGGHMGYGYQWWLPAGSQGEFTGLGVYGQFLYVDPARKVVIAKNSVDVDFQKNGFEHGQITLSLFRTIAHDLAASTPAP